ncbi:hypothetical protein ACTXT7_009527 [Hymenolepis weldensis]
MAVSDDRTTKRCFLVLLGDCKMKAWWKISNGIINETKRQTEAESPECTPEEGLARQERKLNQRRDLRRTLSGSVLAPSWSPVKIERQWKGDRSIRLLFQ